MRKRNIERGLGIAMLLTGVLFVIALALVSAEDTEKPTIRDGSSNIDGTTGEDVTVWVHAEDNVEPTKGIVYFRNGSKDWNEKNMSREDLTFQSLYWEENTAIDKDKDSNKIDVGRNAAPTFVDLDGDDDYDMVIGEWDGYLNYYENIGTPSEPKWERKAEMFSGIDVGYFSTPSFVDLDNDGDYDIVIGAVDGKLRYYENTGNAENPKWLYKNRLRKSGGGEIDIKDLSAPTFVDLDADGDYDLVIGEEDGYINYYKNTGNNSAPEWTTDSGTFEEIDVGQNSTPVFEDLDKDGDYDMIVGAHAGHLVYYRNIGNQTNFTWEKDPKNFSGIDIGYDSSPAFADLDNDGDMDLMIGIGGKSYSTSGQLKYYENINLYNFSYSFTLQNHTTTNWLYSIHIFDDEDNIVHYPGELEYYTITVKDNDKPTHQKDNASKDVYGTTGDEVMVWVVAKDNIEPYEALIIYDGSETPITMNKEMIDKFTYNFSYNIMLKNDSIEEMGYHIIIMDQANNEITYNNKTESEIPKNYFIYVTDDNAPEIIDGTENLTWSTEENTLIWIHAKDNIELGDAYFYYNETGEIEGDFKQEVMIKEPKDGYTNFSYNLSNFDNNVTYYIIITDNQSYENNASHGNKSEPYYIFYDEPPTADAGENQTVNQEIYGGVSVTFNGSGSKDYLPGQLYYKWNFSDMDSIDNIQEGFNLINPLHFYMNPGEYNVTLNVTDEGNNSAEDWVIINIKPYVWGTININGANVSLRSQEVNIETLAKNNEYRLDIDPGTYVLHANAPGYYDFDMEIYITESKNIVQNIILEQFKLIEEPENTYVQGWVKKNNSIERIPGAKVSLIDYQDPNNPRTISNITSKAAGRYKIFTYGGNFKLVCEHNDYNIYTEIIRIKEGEPMTGNNITLDVKEILYIDGYVTNETGPLANANVTLYNFTENYEITHQTDDKGYYNISAYSGIFRLKVEYSGHFNSTSEDFNITTTSNLDVKLDEIPTERNYTIKGEVWYKNNLLEGANITLYDRSHSDYMIKTQTYGEGGDLGWFNISVYEPTNEYILIVEYPGLQSYVDFVKLDQMEIEKIIYLKKTMQDITNTTITFNDWNNSIINIRKTLNANIGKQRFNIDRLFGNGDGNLTKSEVEEWNNWLQKLGGDILDTENDFKVNNTYFQVEENSYNIAIDNAEHLINSTEPINITITYNINSEAGLGDIDIKAMYDTYLVDYVYYIYLPDNFEVFANLSSELINITYPIKKSLRPLDVIIDPIKQQEEGDEIIGGPLPKPIESYEWIILNIEENTPPKGIISLNESLDLDKSDEYYVVPTGEVSFSANASTDTHEFLNEWLEYAWYTTIDEDNETLGTESYVLYNFTDTGDYNIWLKVEDSLGAVNWTNTTIIVDDEIPTSKITVIIDDEVVKDKFEIDEGKTIAFNGSECKDDPIGKNYLGGLYNYSWEFGDGNYENDTIAKVSDMATKYTYDKPTREDKKYVVNLTIWDKAGNKETTSIEIKVNDTTKPKVKFEFNETVDVNEEVTFNATNSTDPEDGEIKWYNWSFGDDKYSNGTNVTVTHIYDKAGEYTVTLNITDMAGNWNKYGPPITVEEIPKPDVGIKNMTFSNDNPEEGEEITINATVYNYGKVDAKNITVKFYWSKKLFSLDSEYKKYLNDGKISDTLKNVFDDNGTSLSNDAKVSKIKEKLWKIIDGNKKYIIEDTDTQLNAYQLNPIDEVNNVTLKKDDEEEVSVKWTAVADAYSILVFIDETNVTEDPNQENNEFKKTILVEKKEEESNRNKIILVVIIVIIAALIVFRLFFGGGKGKPEKKGKSKKGKK